MDYRDITQARSSVRSYRRLLAGSTLRLWRALAGRTQRDVAEAAGLLPSRLSRIETGGGATAAEVKAVALAIGPVFAGDVDDVVRLAVGGAS